MSVWTERSYDKMSARMGPPVKSSVPVLLKVFLLIAHAKQRSSLLRKLFLDNTAAMF